MKRTTLHASGPSCFPESDRVSGPPRARPPRRAPRPAHVPSPSPFCPFGLRYERKVSASADSALALAGVGPEILAGKDSFWDRREPAPGDRLRLITCPKANNTIDEVYRNISCYKLKSVHSILPEPAQRRGPSDRPRAPCLQGRGPSDPGGQCWCRGCGWEVSLLLCAVRVQEHRTGRPPLGGAGYISSPGPEGRADGWGPARGQTP